jgi:methylated-DNA-[protein]-cysteine S-methyltransferase
VIVYDMIDTPVGELLLTATADGLTGVRFPRPSGGHRPEAGWQRADALPGAASGAIAAARAELDAYFAGQLTAFTVPLAAAGTPFQQRVWTALRDIAFGETISYLEMARRLGDPKAVRAVGGANGRNPIPVIVPCHRVIGADGSLTGFGGGLERKRWLLRHEGALPEGLQLAL